MSDFVLMVEGDPAVPTNEALVLRVVRYLVEEGMLTAYNEEAEESDRVFRTTSRYQLQVRELAALRLFEELTEIMNGPPISQGGLVRRPAGPRGLPGGLGEPAARVRVGSGPGAARNRE